MSPHRSASDSDGTVEKVEFFLGDGAVKLGKATTAPTRSAMPEVALADAGYWHQKQMESVVGRGIQVLIPARLKEAQRPATRPGRRLLPKFSLRFTAADDEEEPRRVANGA